MQENNHAIKFGTFAGLGTVVFLFLFYWIEKTLMLSPSVIWSTIFLYLIGMYMAAVEVRKENGGYVDFRTALKASFLVWVIANAIYHAFNYVLYNFLDKDMINVQKAYVSKQMEEMEGVISDDYLEDMNQNIAELTYDLSQVISTYATSLVMGFLIAMIIARMVKRQPTFEA